MKIYNLIKIKEMFAPHYNEKLSVGLSYKIYKLCNSIEQEERFFNQKRQDVIEEFGQRDENGEIVIHTEPKTSCGIFLGYYLNEEATKNVWHDGMYHTGDLAWRDEDGYYWYVGRADDVIKSSGYRIGPFEIESTIMELPYVLECGVCAAPDEVRGQVVKACIVLVPGTEATEELKKDIQNYVKLHTAPYKYPRIVEFRKELPKTISGKIIRNKL